MVIAGVALYDHVILDGAELTGELAEPAPIAGVTAPAETWVWFDPSTGKLDPATRSPVVDP
jgi:hypothetical protein